MANFEMIEGCPKDSVIYVHGHILTERIKR